MDKREMDELKSMLSLHKGHFVHVCIPGGNVGDQLIHYGLRNLLIGCGIIFKEFEIGQPVSGDVLFVAGCGGYCRFWHSLLTTLQPYFLTFKKMYILPSTFDKDYKPTLNFLLNLPKNSEVFCREQQSYKFVSKLLGKRTFLSKDTAFYIPWENYINEGHGVLYAFRTDKESAHKVGIRMDNIDISLTANNYEEMLKKISSYKEIHTDRAHVAISGAMLQKKTIVYDCGYFKVKAIYDYSLSKLSNTEFKRRSIIHKLPWYLQKTKKIVFGEK